MTRVFFAWVFLVATIIIVYMFTERITWIKKYIMQGESPF